MQKWSHPPLKASTKELLTVSVFFGDDFLWIFIIIHLLFLKNAEKSGYAVGAFNVYNLEGVDAVIAAAEAEKSPAILQVEQLSF